MDSRGLLHRFVLDHLRLCILSYVYQVRILIPDHQKPESSELFTFASVCRSDWALPASLVAHHFAAFLAQTSGSRFVFGRFLLYFCPLFAFNSKYYCPVV